MSERMRVAAVQTIAGDNVSENLAQAEALDVMLTEVGKPLTAVVQMEVPYAELTRRIAGRLSCQNCGRVFNIYSMPVGAPLVCPSCVGKPALFQRPDDNEDTVGRRLHVYDEKTRPLVDFYRERGILSTIDAEGEVVLPRSPLAAAPTPMPRKPISEMGVSRTRRSPTARAVELVAQEHIGRQASGVGCGLSYPEQPRRLQWSLTARPRDRRDPGSASALSHDARRLSHRLRLAVRR